MRSLSIIYSSIIAENLPILKRLLLKRSVFEEIRRESEKAYPLEACGVLFGRLEGEEAIVSKYRSLRNVIETPGRFWFSEREWMKVICEERKLGLDYIGLFHSHPRGSPIPSPADRHRMLECPGEVWVIAAYEPKKLFKLCAWVILDLNWSFSKIYITVVQEGISGSHTA
ncbi:MAG: hypothetical protein DRJ52_07340 [Thermoprotei archaeon]|nr:MAG: hypothetical protein DRJ52_07340 [Thermoprotei archaeon]RLF00862.1 MAG: hypothetical protein DRJ63_01170 [Thermoprotei archaeon]HDI74439.1 M67 family peptidase [Thermoprotei archaeon]